MATRESSVLDFLRGLLRRTPEGPQPGEAPETAIDLAPIFAPPQTHSIGPMPEEIRQLAASPLVQDTFWSMFNRLGRPMPEIHYSMYQVGGTVAEYFKDPRRIVFRPISHNRRYQDAVDQFGGLRGVMIHEMAHDLYEDLGFNVSAEGRLEGFSKPLAAVLYDAFWSIPDEKRNSYATKYNLHEFTAELFRAAFDRLQKSWEKSFTEDEAVAELRRDATFPGDKYMMRFILLNNPMFHDHPLRPYVAKASGAAR